MNLQALIVEDNTELSELLAEILASLDIQTEIAYEGRTASQKLKETVPDLVVLDIHLPHISGVELLKQIRGSDRLRKIKVIVVTADALMAEATQGQADATLIKPIHINDLRNTVARLIPGVGN